MLQAIRHDTATTRPYPASPAPTQVGSLAALPFRFLETPRPQTRGTAETQVGSLAALPVRFLETPRPQTRGTAAVIPLHPRSATVPQFEPDEPKEPTKEDRLDAELQSYLELPYGWDGYDGIPAPLAAVRDAFEFLSKRPSDIPLPYPQIGPDGEIGLYWRAEDVFAEVSFYGDGEYSYHARHAPRGGEPFKQGRDGCSLALDSWDPGLLLVLNKIAR